MCESTGKGDCPFYAELVLSRNTERTAYAPTGQSLMNENPAVRNQIDEMLMDEFQTDQILHVEFVQ